IHQPLLSRKLGCRLTPLFAILDGCAVVTLSLESAEAEKSGSTKLPLRGPNPTGPAWLPRTCVLHDFLVDQLCEVFLSRCSLWSYCSKIGIGFLRETCM